MKTAAVLLDPALPGLAQALDAGFAGPRIRALLARHHPDEDEHGEIVAIDVLKHKPGRRCSLAYTIRSGEEFRTVFAKTFQSDRGASILLTMSRLAEAVPRHRLLIPRPLGYLPELRLLVTEFIDGTPLATALLAGNSTEPARRMAEALAVLHASETSCARRWTPQKELRNTVQWVSGLTGRTPGSGSVSRALLERLVSWSDGLPPAPCEPIHRDYYLDQVMDSDGQTALLDLDDARDGDPAVDVGNFVAHLTLRSLQFPETATGTELARSVFLEEYLARRGTALDADSIRGRIRFYEAASLLRLSGVYSARDRWARSLPPALLDTCEEILDEER